MEYNHTFDQGELEELLQPATARAEQLETILLKHIKVPDLTHLVSSYTVEQRLYKCDILVDTGTYLWGQDRGLGSMRVPRLVTRVTPKMVITRPVDNTPIKSNFYSDQSYRLFEVKTILRVDEQGPFIAIPAMNWCYTPKTLNYRPLLRIWRPLSLPRVLSNIFFDRLMTGPSNRCVHFPAVPCSCHRRSIHIITYLESFGMNCLTFPLKS